MQNRLLSLTVSGNVQCSRASAPFHAPSTFSTTNLMIGNASWPGVVIGAI
jgi:hypothetical protein